MARAFGIASFIALVAVLGMAEVYVLVAKSDLKIRRVVNMPDSPENLVTILGAGHGVVVIGCEDYKSDVAVKVQFESDQLGYVSDGDFYLKKGRVVMHLFSEPYMLVWSCRRLFNVRKIE